MESLQIGAYSLKIEYALRGDGRFTSPERVTIHLTSDAATLKCHTTYKYGFKYGVVFVTWPTTILSETDRHWI